MKIISLLLLWLTAFLGDSTVGAVPGTPCPEGVSNRLVSTTADALELSDALLCLGRGQFEVEWSGEVLLTRTITISNESSVTVWGHDAEEAVVDGGGAVRLFEVNSGSTLEINNVSLMGGSVENEGTFAGIGGAVLISDFSQLTASSCSFISNNANASGGAIASSASEISIDGDTTFTNNTVGIRGQGGAIIVHGGGLIIDGNTTFANNTAGDSGDSDIYTRQTAPELPEITNRRGLPDPLVQEYQISDSGSEKPQRYLCVTPGARRSAL